MAKNPFGKASLSKFARKGGYVTGHLMGRLINSAHDGLAAMENLGSGKVNQFMTLAAQAIRAPVQKLQKMSTQAYALDPSVLREQPKGSLSAAFRQGLARGTKAGIKAGQAAKENALARKRTPDTKPGFVPT